MSLNLLMNIAEGDSASGSGKSPVSAGISRVESSRAGGVEDVGGTGSSEEFEEMEATVACVGIGGSQSVFPVEQEGCGSGVGVGTEELRACLRILAVCLL